jgi:hypothetical protein
MNERKVASEMLVLARELLGMEFDTKEEMDDYKREHDVRPGTKMTVKPGNTDSDERAKFFEHKSKNTDNSREKLLKHLTKHPEITPKTHTIHEYAPNHGEHPEYNYSEHGGYTLTPRPNAKPYKNEKVVTKMWDDIGRGSEKHSKKVTGELLVLARELLGLEFDTKKEMDDYKREHEVRRDTKMTVKPEAKKEPAKTSVREPAKEPANKEDEQEFSFAKRMSELEKRNREDKSDTSPWRGLDKPTTRRITKALELLDHDDPDARKMWEKADAYKNAWKKFDFNTQTNNRSEKALDEYEESVKVVIEKAEKRQ